MGDLDVISLTSKVKDEEGLDEVRVNREIQFVDKEDDARVGGQIFLLAPNFFQGRDLEAPMSLNPKQGREAQLRAEEGDRVKQPISNE